MGAGQPIIFLHGWGGNKDSMCNLSLPLQNEFCTISVDLFGFGETEHPTYPLNVADYALAIVELITELQLKDVIIVGHSFGGRVAIYIAANYGFLVEKLILISSAGLIPKRGLRYKISTLNYKFRRKFNMPVDMCGSSDYRALSGNIKRTFVNVINYNQRDMLNHILCPTLILWGKLDRETPLYMAKIINKSIKKSELFVFGEGGHFVYIDCYSAVMLQLKAFIGREI
ncbi:MAG: alpha/beta hydrolase [Bacillota bacterium]